jgi:uncharacterized membrane protein (UPF0127 family)
MGQSKRLYNQTAKSELASRVELAVTFFERTRGLLGRSQLPDGQALWIQGTPLVSCNSIHTLFMRFAIDAVFVDRNLIVKKVYRDLAPWRMTWPAAGAYSVFELPAGTLQRAPVNTGDQMHVGD